MKKILFSLVALVCSMSMNAQVMKVMKGNEVVATYTAEQADNVVFEEMPLGEPFTLTALEDNSTVSIDYDYFQYRTTGQTEWTDYEHETPISVNSGQYVQFRGKPTETRTSVGKTFIMTAGSFDASGNVMSLLNGPEMGSSAFYRLFYNCAKLKSASELLLPAATTLTTRCYYQMFSGCTSLTTAPTLPAITDGGYQGLNSMFDGCRKLQSVTVKFTSWPTGTNPTTAWLKNAGADVPTGAKTFRCPSVLGTRSTIPEDNDHVPSGWNVVNL